MSYDMHMSYDILGVNSQYILVSKCFYFHQKTVDLCFYMQSYNKKHSYSTHH